VQSVDAIKSDLEPRLQALHRIADEVYALWIRGLAG